MDFKLSETPCTITIIFCMEFVSLVAVNSKHTAHFVLIRAKGFRLINSLLTYSSTYLKFIAVLNFFPSFTTVVTLLF